ncbi:MAG: hypothetical protein HY719_11625 [Planctomycetes bacterium]|nr:hypothetical protein [Planctomycetota bacterium]
MKKRILGLVLLGFVALSVGGCYHWLDIEHDKHIFASIKRDFDENNEFVDRILFGYDKSDPFQYLKEQGG